MMIEDICLTIPTYRLGEAAETAFIYKKHFDRYGHRQVPIILFDDTALSNEISRQKIAARGIFYVGAAEKARFIDELVQRVGVKHENIIRHLLRPSYGGNRNVIALYTLGQKYISVDDDMRPDGLEYRQSVKLGKQEVLRGIFQQEHTLNGHLMRQEKDLLNEYLQVLGKRVKDLQHTYMHGRILRDSMNDLFTNTTTAKIKNNVENTVVVEGDEINPEARVIVAQSFKTGMADLDATDFAQDILDPENESINISMKYIAQGYQPCVTATNWRFDTGVAGYDNRFGLPPFLPTTLRTEEYVLRLLGQHPNFAAAHIGASQLHLRAATQRKSLGYDIYNEELVQVLRTKLRGLVRKIDETTILFERDGHIPLREAQRMIEKAIPYYSAAKEKAHKSLCQEQKGYFNQFSDDLEEYFCNFDAALFRRAAEKKIRTEIDTIVEAMQIWPEILDKTFKLKKADKLRLVRP